MKLYVSSLKCIPSPDGRAADLIEVVAELNQNKLVMYPIDDEGSKAIKLGDQIEVMVLVGKK